jgi:transcriptional regulator with XRE-family HTH domain
MREIRKSKRLFQKDLAKSLNTTQAQISKYENLYEKPTLEKLVEIAICLDVTLDELIEIKKLHEDEKDY